VLERYGPWAEHDFFVCGAPGMVRATLGTPVAVLAYGDADPLRLAVRLA
jgi:NAD(P)H-flavin reductase